MATMVAIDSEVALGVPAQQLPRHVAVIMDGNGRWAQGRGLPRVFGHRNGVEAVRDTVTAAARIGLECLTLYSFSVENWKRPADEVDALMSLCADYLEKERTTLVENNIQLMQLGRREGLPPRVLAELDRTSDATAGNTGMVLALALNYGSRVEITDAVRSIARDVADGQLDPADITEAVISRRLYSGDLPDVDLLIRTAGQYRISNFMLWQISYAELHVTDVLWPDFRSEDLFEAIREYAGRERRFGGVPTLK